MTDLPQPGVPDRKPVYLLADSQVLFLNDPNSRFITSFRENLAAQRSTVNQVAYIGASNGDQQAFFDLFVAAMDAIDLHESRMIKSEFSELDCVNLERADLIVLAGGDIQAGWDIIQNSGMHDVIRRRYLDGDALVLGVSAGAVHMGMGHVPEGQGDTFVSMLNLVPHYIDTRQEDDDWSRTKQAMETGEADAHGFGIPAGGGMIYHPDATIEPLRKPLIELQTPEDAKQASIEQSLIYPDDEGDQQRDEMGRNPGRNVTLN